MIETINIKGKNVSIKAAYMYGDISILYINGKNSGVTMWNPLSRIEVEKHIKKAVEVIYGKDIKYTINK